MHIYSKEGVSYMFIGISSDNHFDINHVNLNELIPQQAEYLHQRNISYYLITGDLFNNFEQSIDYVERLQQATSKTIKICFIAGNHDMLNGVTYQELEQPNLHPQYLHHRILRLPEGRLSIIGNNGWYDYSFVDHLVKKTPTEISHWKQSFWVDQKIDSPLTDQERMKLVLQQVDNDFQIATNRHDRIIFITHFVPHQNFIFDQLDHPRWQIINGFLGSRKLGDLTEKYAIEYTAFGHLHTRNMPQTIANTTYIHQPLGYGIKRAFEWQQTDFLTEWQQTLQILQI